MENIFDILKEYKKLNTSFKKESYINQGLYSKKWKEISFKAEIEDLTATNIYACPLSDNGERSEQMIFIRYHKDTLRLKKFPFVNKTEVQKIRGLNKTNIIKGVAIFEEISPTVTLILKRLE